MIQNEHVYAICCWPEEADDVIYDEDEETFQQYVCTNVRLTAIFK